MAFPASPPTAEPNTFGDVVETFAAMARWFTPEEMSDVSNWADEARRERARQLRDIHAFFLAHPR